MLPTRIPPKIVLNGKSYEINPLPMASLGRVQGLISQRPNPKPFKDELKVIKDLQAEGLIPDDEAKDMRASAYRASTFWPPSLLQDFGQAQQFLLYDDEIRAEFVCAALSPKPPQEEAKAIAETITAADFEAVMSAAMAFDSEGDKSDPKAPAGSKSGSTGEPATVE